ncbi:EAL domain-containing protein [Novosphingobium sp. KCTC 2891]|uniref:putative bifunctional diguanylate cyclase/phosphodiesterase n=1 Tax=Novosphingobium sp. KCTC 2891 TaxID=2989730 RepID=UPI0022213027|nr:EAL domain-containing protein [Novosphingobium sp. KCTC 2891]MCW1384022.1 EAL domain-containing protein [Novosphingobium sp. KCTC 2891]
MTRLRRLSGLVRAAFRQHDGDAFTQAYANSLSRRLPLLYLVVVFALMLLMVRFMGRAPPALLAAGPALCLFAGWRARHWLPHRVRRRSVDQLRADLDRMSQIGGFSGLLFVSWGLALYPFGDNDARSLIHYMLAVAMISGVLGLAHAPATALRIALAFVVPSSLFFLIAGHPNAVYVTLVQLVVTAILLFVSQGHHHDFVGLELSRQQLARREQATARLAGEATVRASIDPLTGGLNRGAILERVEEAIGSPSPVKPWLALIDLDGFKLVNDTYGHAAGDEALKVISERIAAVPGVLASGRLGGDEFAVLFDAALEGPAMAGLAARLVSSIREEIGHQEARLRLSASIGLHRVRGEGLGGCLERADAALYKAKDRGDGSVVLFGPDDEVALQERIEITRRFNDCALDDRLKLLYQPIHDFDGGRIVTVEALARWSPDGVQWHAPGTFLAIAEATRRTGELTRLVLARALAECRPWETGISIAINLSPRDIVRDGAVERIAAIVRDAGAVPQSITLEVTERAIMADPRRAAMQLAAFRELGFRIALDDFGAGWSSLSQLRDLPLDMIKLDRELAAALPGDPDARAIVGMIVALSWQLGIDCTLEGVETEEQAEAARALGIRLMQGYYFSRPGTLDEALAAAHRAVA